MASQSGVTSTSNDRSSVEELYSSDIASRESLPLRTIALGMIGSLLLLAGSIGGAGTLIHDPILGSGPLSALRYGHGKDIATAIVYAGFGILVWAWIRLGRGVLARLVGSRGVLLATVIWVLPMLIAPPLFTRDVYSYLGQGLLALHGLDPYSVGPAALVGPIPDNVHPTWQTTPAPYGPLFIALAKGIILLAGDGMVSSVILTRMVLLVGLVMLIYALPGLVKHLGGRLPVALWLGAASPMMVVHLVGGPHNDLLLLGMLALGTLWVLDGKHVAGITLVSLAMATKATAGLALPFLVWVWAARLSGSRWQRFTKAVIPALGVFSVAFGLCTVLAKVDFGWLPALSAPGMIVNYLSPPTALGQFAHAVAGLFGPADGAFYVEAGRTVGSLALAIILIRQWWLARDGGTTAVRRAAVVLFVSAVLSPIVHPWYLTWAVAIACALPWSSRALAWMVGGLVAVVLAYYPDGEQAMYNWPLVAVALGAAVLAGLSLVRFDPLGLSRILPDWHRTPLPGGHGPISQNASSAVGTVNSAAASHSRSHHESGQQHEGQER